MYIIRIIIESSKGSVEAGKDAAFLVFDKKRDHPAILDSTLNYIWESGIQNRRSPGIIKEKSKEISKEISGDNTGDNFQADVSDTTLTPLNTGFFQCLVYRQSFQIRLSPRSMRSGKSFILICE